MLLRRATLHQPSNIVELAELVSAYPDAGLLGGGTLAVPEWWKAQAPEHIVYMPSIEELRERAPGFWGAAVTLAELADDASAPSVFREAASCVGSRAVRNGGTIGGNLGASSPACLGTALLVTEGSLLCLGQHQDQRVEKDIGQALGVPDSPILGVVVRLGEEAVTGFRKITLGAAGARVVSLAVRLSPGTSGGECKLAVGCTGTRPHRLPRAEQEWKAHSGRPEEGARAAGAKARREVICGSLSPVDEGHRRHAVGALVERTLKELEGAMGG